MPVYTDTALCARHLDQKKFDWAAEQFGADRILFGTDMPWANMEKEMSYIQKSFFGAGDQEKNFSWERACLVRALWDDTASVHIKLFGLRGVFIKITWLGHSCFKIESKGYQIILDPYQDGSVPGYRPIAE